MTDLDHLLDQVFKDEANQDKVNQFYLAFLKTTLILPVIKNEVDTEEPFTPLYMKEEDNYFVCIFDTVGRLSDWSNDQEVEYVELSGLKVMSGMNPDVYLCLNVGTPYFKQFAPDEMRHLKKIVAKIENLKQPNVNE